MTTFRFFILLALAAFTFLTVPARAVETGNEHLFTIYGIEVDETARTAAAARQIALAKAEQEAFQKLLERLLLQEDVARFQMPEGYSAADYVLGFEVEEERNSRVRYIGTLDVTFDSQKIEDLLGFQNIPYVAFAPRPVLVLPLYWKEGAPLLWSAGNLFMNAWRNAGGANAITRYVVPDGTVSERISISADQAWNGRQMDDLDVLKARYGADTVLIASAKFLRNTRGQLETLVITLKHPGPDPVESTRTYPAEGVLSEDALLEAAVTDIISSEEQAWKARALTQFGEEHEMPLVVPIADLEDWATIQKRLQDVAVVRKVDIVRVALPESFIAITYAGSEEQLALALRQKGLILQPLGRGYAIVPADIGFTKPGENGE